jgi:hypothetical protein
MPPTHCCACGGPRPQVDYDVEYRPSGATDDLDLFMRGGLEVEPAQRAAMAIERHTPLGVLRAKHPLQDRCRTSAQKNSDPRDIQCRSVAADRLACKALEC